MVDEAVGNDLMDGVSPLGDRGEQGNQRTEPGRIKLHPAARFARGRGGWQQIRLPSGRGDQFPERL